MEKAFLFLSAWVYFLCRIAQYGLAISTDDWGVLKASRLALEGHFPVGDPNKTFELIVGLIPAVFDEPLLFPIITALFGAAICVAVYDLVYALTHDKALSLCGWGTLLISPVLYWQVLNCNSVVYAAAFLTGSLYYFTAGRFDKGCLLLTLAGFCRPEPFILAVPVAGYYFLQWRRGNVSRTEVLKTVFILAMPPLWLLLFNVMKSGNPASSFMTVQNYTRTTLLDFDFFNFIPVFGSMLSTYYLNFFAALAAVAGCLLFLFRPQKLYFLYSYLVFTILGYWVLGAMHFTMIERFLLTTHIYLTVFSLLLFGEVKNKLCSLSGKVKSFSFVAALLPFIFILLNLNLSAHGAIAHNLSYNADFDDDIPKVALILRKELGERKDIRILMTARRAAMLSYLLHDLDSRYTTVDFGALFVRKSDLKKEKIDLVVYAPDDIYPLQSAFNAFDLLSDEGLKNQGVRMAETTTISEHTKLLRIVRLETHNNDSGT